MLLQLPELYEGTHKLKLFDDISQYGCFSAHKCKFND